MNPELTAEQQQENRPTPGEAWIIDVPQTGDDGEALDPGKWTVRPEEAVPTWEVFARSGLPWGTFLVIYLERERDRLDEAERARRN